MRYAAIGLLLPLTGMISHSALGEEDYFMVGLGYAEELILVPDAIAMDLAGRFSNDDQQAELRKQLQTHVEEGRATILETALAQGRSGQRFRIESGLEITYPTEWKQADVSFPWPHFMESRVLGYSMEMDPVLGADGLTLDTRITSLLTRYAGERPLAPLSGEAAEKGDVLNPRFTESELTTSLTILAGEMTMAGMGPADAVLEDAEGMTLMRFLYADTLPVRGPPDEARRDQTQTIRIQLNLVQMGRERWLGHIHSRSLRRTFLESGREFMSSLNEEGIQLLATAQLECRSGQRAKTESTEEVTWISEFDPPAEKSGASTVGAMDLEELGFSVEIDPVLSVESSMMDLNLSVTQTGHFGESVHRRRSEWGKSVPDVTSPRFHRMNTVTSLGLVVGQPQIVSVLTPPDETGEPDWDQKVILIVEFLP